MYTICYSSFMELRSLIKVIKRGNKRDWPMPPRLEAGRGGEATPTFRSAVGGWCVYEVAHGPM